MVIRWQDPGLGAVLVYEAESNVLEVYVRRLRCKLGEPDLIETAHDGSPCSDD